MFLVLRSNPRCEPSKKNLKKSKLFLNFPYLLGVWVGDKRRFEPYTFDDDIVSICIGYIAQYFVLYKSLYHSNERFSRIDEKKFLGKSRAHLAPKQRKGRNRI